MDGVEELLALEGDALLGFTGNDLAVIGVVALDELRDEQGFAPLEGHLIFAHAHLDIARVAQNAAQFGDALGRDDELDFLAAREFDFEIHEGQTAPIGRHERQFVFLEREQDAV